MNSRRCVYSPHCLFFWPQTAPRFCDSLHSLYVGYCPAPHQSSIIKKSAVPGCYPCFLSRIFVHVTDTVMEPSDPSFFDISVS